MEILTSYLVNVADNANTHNCLLHGHAGQCCMNYGWKWWNFWKKTNIITSHCCSSLLCRSHLIWVYSCSNAATGLDAHHFTVGFHTWAPRSYIVLLAHLHMLRYEICQKTMIQVATSTFYVPASHVPQSCACSTKTEPGPSLKDSKWNYQHTFKKLHCVTPLWTITIRFLNCKSQSKVGSVLDFEEKKNKLGVQPSFSGHLRKTFHTQEEVLFLFCLRKVESHP